ncbi:MAG: tripartite tricarboxylate transporter permease [Tagaea sp.]|nr:tripartite tricarboxylate transporter permease [Tagaea sp.]
MDLAQSFLHLLTAGPLSLLLIGTALGIVVGALPGLTGGALLALSLPFTYRMSSVDGVILMTSMYVGGISGGLITATLMRIPGEPASVVTTLDGFPMARGGRPGRALGLGISASVIGGTISWLALVTIAPAAARMALVFGPFENFALVFMALVLIATLSQGSVIKGLLAGLFGMLVSFPGVDETSGQLRLTFGFSEVAGGFSQLAMILGAFAVSQALADAMHASQRFERLDPSVRGIFLSARDYVAQSWNLLRSAIIGVWIGILPGVGASISSIVAYSTAKNMSKTPEKFGTGFEDGIVASEAANNANTGGALIPMITLGIPGSPAASILLAGLLMHNIQPGPTLFTNSPDVVGALMATHLAAHLVMFVMMVAGCIFVAKLMYVPRGYVLPIIVVLCAIGALAENGRGFDLWTMLAFGAIGFAFELAAVPLGPFVIGLILAPLAEGQLRAGLMATDGSLWPILDRPVAMTFLIVSLVMFAWPLWREWRRTRLQP